MAHTSIPRSPVYASPSCNTYVTWRNHGTHSNESCRTHQYRDHLHDLCMFHPPATCMRHDSFMSHVGTSGVTHIHTISRNYLSDLCVTQLSATWTWHDSFMSHVRMGHVTHWNASPFWKMYVTWRIHGTRRNESCHTWKRSRAHVGKSHVTCRNSSCHKYRVAKMHRLPSLDRVISAKEPYN